MGFVVCASYHFVKDSTGTQTKWMRCHPGVNCLILNQRHWILSKRIIFSKSDTCYSCTCLLLNILLNGLLREKHKILSSMMSFLWVGIFILIAGRNPLLISPPLSNPDVCLVVSVLSTSEPQFGETDWCRRSWERRWGVGGCGNFTGWGWRSGRREKAWLIWTDFTRVCLFG